MLPIMEGNVSTADEIEKLDSLRTRGIITQAEFEQQKNRLFQHAPLSTSAATLDAKLYPYAASNRSQRVETIPFYRKMLFLVITYCLFPPLTLLVMWSGPIYRKGGVNGQYVPFSLGWKIIFTIFCILAMAALLYLIPPFFHRIYEQRVAQAAAAARGS